MQQEGRATGWQMAQKQATQQEMAHALQEMEQEQIRAAGAGLVQAIVTAMLLHATNQSVPATTAYAPIILQYIHEQLPIAPVNLMPQSHARIYSTEPAEPRVGFLLPRAHPSAKVTLRT